MFPIAMSALPRLAPFPTPLHYNEVERSLLCLREAGKFKLPTAHSAHNTEIMPGSCGAQFIRIQVLESSQLCGMLNAHRFRSSNELAQSLEMGVEFRSGEHLRFK